MVEIELDPNETVIAEAGAMMYMDEPVLFEAKMGDGSQANQSFFGKLLSAGSRVLTGESLFLTHFTNKGYGKAHVAFSAPYPGTIIPVELNNLRAPLIVQKDGFLCAAKGTRFSICLNPGRSASTLVGLPQPWSVCLNPGPLPPPCRRRRLPSPGRRRHKRSDTLPPLRRPGR